MKGRRKKTMSRFKNVDEDKAFKEGIKRLEEYLKKNPIDLELLK